jgi:hypothetical protein
LFPYDRLPTVPHLGKTTQDITTERPAPAQRTTVE